MPTRIGQQVTAGYAARNLLGRKNRTGAHAKDAHGSHRTGANDMRGAPLTLLLKNNSVYIGEKFAKYIYHNATCSYRTEQIHP
ncbi:hypothetical protein O0880_11775 [Janthinobacterium sp. SUN118]|uniref:hypothetical protein n=1 Tax=Janthinobacterium sp. SUN118 TaxID=3004100 RepID=UPI0025B03CC1|nr:hypothetical protein [Janthinobacterium sp. SUN118]MDN2710096.1 hypothetical protein [Janthinobacterium sp. SUN118]